jgi:hypothetical protein
MTMIQTKIQSLAILDASSHGLSKSQRRPTSIGTDTRQLSALTDNKEPTASSILAALPVSECTIIELLQTPIEQSRAPSNLFLWEMKTPTKKSSLQESPNLLLPTFSSSGKPQKEPMSSIAEKKVMPSAAGQYLAFPRIRCISAVPSLQFVLPLM